MLFRKSCKSISIAAILMLLSYGIVSCHFSQQLINDKKDTACATSFASSFLKLIIDKNYAKASAGCGGELPPESARFVFQQADSLVGHLKEFKIKEVYTESVIKDDIIRSAQYEISASVIFEKAVGEVDVVYNYIDGRFLVTGYHYRV